MAAGDSCAGGQPGPFVHAHIWASLTRLGARRFSMTQPASPEPTSHSTHSGPQAGITNRPPEQLLLAALTLTGPDARGAVEALRQIVQAELTSKLDSLGPPDQPPAETGELGFDSNHDRAHLTITVGFSSTGFDKLGVDAADRPADLVPAPWQLLGDSPANVDAGDVLLQICADNSFITEHVLRRIEHHLQGQFQLAWVHTGAQRYTSRPG